jgi:two-component system sensor histidine kinase and response regulator WspE
VAEDLSGFSMLELFRLEADTQTAVLSAGILAIERLDQSAQTIEAMMRAAHSLKGAARIVGVEPAVEVSHALEDCFVAAGRGEIQVRPEHADVLLACVDFLASIGRADDALLPDGPWPGRAMALVAALGRMHSLPEELFPEPSALVAAPAPLPEIPGRFPTPAPLPLSPEPARDEEPPVAIGWMPLTLAPMMLTDEWSLSEPVLRTSPRQPPFRTRLYPEPMMSQRKPAEANSASRWTPENATPWRVS